MSGLVCQIIINGNRLQALMRSTVAMFGGEMPRAEYAIGNAQSLCQLGTLTYDAVEVMSDTQKEHATDMMAVLNAVVQPIVDAGGGTHWRVNTENAIDAFLAASDSLLLAVQRA